MDIRSYEEKKRKIINGRMVMFDEGNLYHKCALFEIEQLALSEGKRIEREGIVKQLKLMANAWDCSHLSLGSKWNEALAQCGKALETYIEKLEE